MLFRLLSILFVLLLASCAISPNELGISQAQWNSYAPEQQQQFIKNHRLIQNNQGTLLQGDSNMSDESMLQVNVHGGQVIMPPFTMLQDYQLVSFTITSGSCKTVPLVQLNAKNKVGLTACYQNKILYLDPSKFDVEKQIGSIRFYFSPLWAEGYTYHHINSSGYVRVTNADITIKSASK